METKTRFKIALSIHSDRTGEKYTAKDFAEEHDCSPRMVWGVIAGTHHSVRLEDAIESFIAKEAEAAGFDLRAREPVGA